MVEASALDVALAYARQGWHVFPLQPRSKAPAVPPPGHHLATVDESTIRAWFTGTDYGIGLALKPSGLVALDVDVSDGKRGRESLSEIAGELTNTLGATTGSGGLHLVYSRTDDSQARRIVRFKDGLDLFGEGYIVVFPSIHPCGGAYRWTHPAPIAPLPEYLAEVARSKRQPSPEFTGNSPRDFSIGGSGYAAAPEATLHSARQRLERHGPAIVGKGGDQHTFEVGAILFRDYALAWEEGWPLALEWNERNEQHGRKWSPERLAMKLRNGATYAQNPIGSERDAIESAPAFAKWVVENAPRPPPGSFAAELVQAMSDVQSLLASASNGANLEPLFERADELLARAIAPTPWLANGLITQGGVGIIGGEPKTSKSWCATEVAIAVATGTPAFGEHATRPARTAYLYAEDHMRSVQNRVRALCAPRGDVDLGRLFLQPKGRFLDLMRDEDVALVVASCRRIGDVELLVLDPLRDIHSGEEDSSDDMSQVMKRARAIGVLLGCAVCLVHHTAKSSADSASRRPGQRLRGSSAIHGALDWALYLSDLTGDGETIFGNSVTSEVKAARGAGRFDLVLTIVDNEQGEAIRAQWSKTKLTDEQKDEAKESADDERLLESIRRHGPVMWTDVRTLCGMRGVAADGARIRLREARAIVEWTDHSLDDMGRLRKRTLVRVADLAATPPLPDARTRIGEG